jgi:ferredoxin-NADP reductase
VRVGQPGRLAAPVGYPVRTGLSDTRQAPWPPAQQRQPRSPGPIERVEGGGRLLCVVLFWFGLATSLELWWLRMSDLGAMADGEALTEVGRAVGIAGGYALLTQVLLMSRAPWLERAIGACALTAWHRRLGALIVTTVLAHLALIVVGYAAYGNEPVLGQAWTMVTTYPDMLAAFAAAGLIALLGLLGLRAVRRAMPYELWYWLHLSGYLVLWLGYAHQFRYGRELANGFGRWFWIGLYALVVTNVAWGRLIHPGWWNLRHRLQVLDVVAEPGGMISIYVSGRRLDRVTVRAGQFFRWRFLAAGLWWQSHPFSLSAAPNGRWLRLTVKAVGRYTHELRRLRPGVHVIAHGPFGAFTAGHARRPRALLIAGGSGIAPIRALLEELPPGAVLLYRARTEAELTFRAELDRLAYHRGTAVRYVLGSRHHPGPRHMLTPDGLRDLVPDVRRRDAYLCGPAGLVEAATATLRRLGVPRRHIHLDPFEL